MISPLKILNKWRYFLLLGMLVSSTTMLDAQENLIPNPDFEHFARLPRGWFFKGEDFTKTIRFWSSATHASPDVYSDRLPVPENWTRRGFGVDIVPESGRTFVGLTVYGCTHGKPHCREYLEVQLSEALIPGQEYEFSMYVSRLNQGLATNHLGVDFISKPTHYNKDTILFRTPTLVFEDILNVPAGQWVQIGAKFTARSVAENLIIGNFYPDSLTLTEQVPDGSQNFGYYYIDNTSLRKTPPYVAVEPDPEDIDQQKLVIDRIYKLKNVLFDFDSDDLHPRSYYQLNKLINVLNDYPTLRIEIRGHTDGLGKKGYNQRLSELRTQSVIDYLMEQNVDPLRIEAASFGETLPIDSNDTEAGRTQNRRVEIRVLDL